MGARHRYVLGSKCVTEGTKQVLRQRTKCGTLLGVLLCRECRAGCPWVTRKTSRPGCPASPLEAGAHQKLALICLSALLSLTAFPSSVFPGFQSTVLKWTWKIKTFHELSQNSRMTLRSQSCP